MTGEPDVPVEKSPEVPSEDSAILMRWIASDPGRYNSEKSPELQAGAFIPNTADEDGISMSQLGCHFQSPDDYLLSCHNENVRAYGGVATVRMSQLRDLGLTVVSTPTEDDPGHVSIREINITAYSQSKQPIKQLANKLAMLAVVVINPQSIPPKPKPE